MYTTIEPSGTIDDYARKTYRYLRIAIIAVVLALIIGIFIDRASGEPLLGSISAYHYTPVGLLFTGALIMIGVCLVAIRGTTDFEDVVLNLAGSLAPIVALVPTACPDELSYCETLSEPFPRVDLFSRNVLAALIAAVVTLAIALFLARLVRDQMVSPKALNLTTKWGLAAAVALVVALILVNVRWGAQGVHNGAAIGLIGGLILVATGNALRHVTDEQGNRSARIAWSAGLAGTAFVLGLAFVAAGIWRALAGASSAWPAIAVGVVLIGLAATAFRTHLGRYLAIWRHADFCSTYLTIASVMLIGGPLVGLAPGELRHRTFWVELAELIPFAVFWLVQTVEYWWNEGTVAIDTPERAAPEGRHR